MARATRAPSVLLTGASGFLGRYLLDELRRRGVAVLTAGRADAPADAPGGRPTGVDAILDLERPESVRAALSAARADVVLNCAAMASLAACEREPARARAVNVEAVATLAASAPRLVQVSTDLVFDGERAPYAPNAAPHPRSVYGGTKAEADGIVVAARGLVVRLPLLFGRSVDGRRGATDMIRSAGPGGLVLFTDEYRTPLHAADAARGLIDLALDPAAAGIAHLAGPERVSRYELGVRFAGAAGLPLLALRPAPGNDPLRPRDVSLRGPWSCGRSLDEALADC